MRTDATMLFQEKVFVALPQESGESILCWVLEHTSSSAEIIIMHVKRRQTGSLNHQVEHYDKCSNELEEEHKTKHEQDGETSAKELSQSQHAPLDKYLNHCATLEFKAKILMIEDWNVAEGILDFTLMDLDEISGIVYGPTMISMELHEQKGQMRSRWVSAIGKGEQLCVLTELEKVLMKQMLTELEKVAGDTEVLRKERHETITKLDHVVLQVAEARRQNVLMMAERDHALEEAKRITSQLEHIMSERDSTVGDAVQLHEQAAQIIAGNNTMLSSQFTLVELQRATQDFNENFKVGQGGFGVVYKGFLRNTTVAIKILSSTGVQGQSDFKHEVTFMNTMRHPNVVTLVGVCPEALAIVYEFMPNGSLEGSLERVAGAPALSWQARTRIIMEICSALSFLHKNTPYAIVHGDIKPANILLDGNLASKLCDFGTSRHLIHSGTASSGTLCTSHPWGTPGYMDPEFHITGVLTARSDTYSSGVTILCMLTARSPLNLARVVRDALERGDLRSVMDTSAGDWPIAQAKRLVRLALRCAEMASDHRPDMAREVWSVVKRLADEANAAEVLAGSNRQHGAGTSVQLNEKKLDIGMENPGVSVQVPVWDQNS